MLRAIQVLLTAVSLALPGAVAAPEVATAQAPSTATADGYTLSCQDETPVGGGGVVCLFVRATSTRNDIEAIDFTMNDGTRWTTAAAPADQRGDYTYYVPCGVVRVQLAVRPEPFNGFAVQLSSPVLDYSGVSGPTICRTATSPTTNPPPTTTPPPATTTPLASTAPSTAVPPTTTPPTSSPPIVTQTTPGTTLPEIVREDRPDTTSITTTVVLVTSVVLLAGFVVLLFVLIRGRRGGEPSDDSEQ